MNPSYQVTNKDVARIVRMQACAFAASGDLESLRSLPPDALAALDQHGAEQVFQRLHPGGKRRLRHAAGLGGAAEMAFAGQGQQKLQPVDQGAAPRQTGETCSDNAPIRGCQSRDRIIAPDVRLLASLRNITLRLAEQSDQGCMTFAIRLQRERLSKQNSCAGRLIDAQSLFRPILAM